MPNKAPTRGTVPANFKKFEFKTAIPPAMGRLMKSGAKSGVPSLDRAVDYRANKYKRNPK